jgi:hypothetical protein
MGYVPPEALERGSQVHSIIEAIDTGSLAPTPPPHLQGYVDAWKKFTYALAPSWDKVEYAFDNPELGFHGIVDRVVECSKDGRYRVVRFESPDDFIVAQQLLETMHDYTHNHSHR